MRLINATTILGALAITAAAGLSACGTGDKADAADGTTAYCHDLKEMKTYFEGFQSDTPDVTALGEAFKRMHALADIAPPAVAKDWATVDQEVDAIEKAMKDAGLTFEELAAMQNGDVPDDVDLDKLTAVGAEFEKLAGGDFDEATAHIAAHAKKTCGFTLPVS
jgi:hypothetical protein